MCVGGAGGGLAKGRVLAGRVLAPTEVQAALAALRRLSQEKVATGPKTLQQPVLQAGPGLLGGRWPEPSAETLPAAGPTGVARGPAGASRA